MAKTSPRNIGDSRPFGLITKGISYHNSKPRRQVHRHEEMSL